MAIEKKAHSDKFCTDKYPSNCFAKKFTVHRRAPAGLDIVNNPALATLFEEYVSNEHFGGKLASATSF